MSGELKLPELPEGMFWRVGPKAKDGSGEYGVSLMGKAREVTRYKNEDILGTGFFNKGKIVGRKQTPYTVMEETVLRFRSFDSFIASSKEKIPEFGIYYGSGGPIDGPPNKYYYKVPVNPQGIQYVARLIWEGYLNEQKWWEAERQTDEEARSYFGDYPPKTLK